MTTPNDAVIENRFISTALIGSTSEPKAMNSSTSITPTTIRPIHGRWAATESIRSTVSAVRPPTSAVPLSGSTSRRSRTMSCERSVWLLPSQTARSSVVSPSAATGWTATIPSTASTSAVYAATSASAVPCSSRLAVDCSVPKSVVSLSAATWAGASSGSTR